jgi:hypothetical protein
MSNGFFEFGDRIGGRDIDLEIILPNDRDQLFDDVRFFRGVLCRSITPDAKTADRDIGIDEG